jgi:hypothetical protein
MTRWDYRLVEIPYGRGDETYELGRLGHDGWEAVAMHVRDNETSTTKPALPPYVLMVLLKRPTQ